MQIKLNLILSVILNAVKEETQIKGRIDKASNPQAATDLAYQETAGDEALHESKLLRGIYTSTDKLKVAIIDYLENSGNTTADNAVSSTIDKDTDSITLYLNVNPRFNTSLIDSLARLCSKYIEDSTLVFWWGATGVQSQVQFYSALLNEDLASIQHLFTKKATKAPAIPYTAKIKTTGSEIEIEVGEESTLSYSIDEGCIDDVDFQISGGAASLCRQANSLVLRGIYPGIAHVVLYSIHDETVFKSIDVIVSGEGEMPKFRRHNHHHRF